MVPLEVLCKVVPEDTVLHFPEKQLYVLKQLIPAPNHKYWRGFNFLGLPVLPREELDGAAPEGIVAEQLLEVLMHTIGRRLQEQPCIELETAANALRQAAEMLNAHHQQVSRDIT